MFKLIVSRLMLPTLLMFGVSGFSQEKKEEVKQSSSGAKLVCKKDPKNPDQLLCDNENQALEEGEILLTPSNVITLRGEVNASMANNFIKKIQELNLNPVNDKIYVFIRSPGGSIFAGDTIVNAILASKREVVTIVDFAASMAFHIAMHGSKRVILTNGVMMQHHASGGIGPAEFPNLDSQWKWLKRKVVRMAVKDAQKCGMEPKKFVKLIDRDLWLNGDEAVKLGCINEVATKVRCSKELQDKIEVQEIEIFNFTVKIDWAGCPMEPAPRKWEVTSKFNSYLSNVPEADQKYIHSYMKMISDPLQYFQVNGSFDVKSNINR